MLFMVSCTKKEATNSKSNTINSVNKKTDTKKIKKEVKKTEKTEKKAHKLDTKSIKDEFYEVNFNFKDELNSADEFLFSINAIPKKGRHINTGFPVNLTIEDGCFKFNQKKYKNKDAKTLDEKSLVFELKSKCEKTGKQELKGNLKFGYCTEEMCYTYNSPFKFYINIK